MTTNQKLLKLSDVQDEIQSGDLLLFRPKGGLFSRLITVGGRGPFSHAGMVIRFKGEPEVYLAEMVVKGGRCEPLRKSIKKWPGQYEWKKVDYEHFPEFKNIRAAIYMRRLARQKYGFFSICKAALLHLPIIRMFVRPDTNDQTIHRYPCFCSQAVSRACVHGGGIDPVQMLSNRLTEPADLARAALWQTRGALEC